MFGYHAHGVDDRTAILPAGWRERLVVVTGENTRYARGWCLEVNDLAIAKYIAGREKDLSFTRALAKHNLTDLAVLRERLVATEIDIARRQLTAARIEADFAVSRQGL